MDEEVPSIFEQFPTMERENLRDLKKFIDLTFRTFARAYGDAIESFFHPLLVFLVWLEKLLIYEYLVITVLGFLRVPAMSFLHEK